MSEEDPFIVLFDDLGREVGENDDAGSGFDSLLAARITPGTYLAAIGEFSEEEGASRSRSK